MKGYFRWSSQLVIENPYDFNHSSLIIQIFIILCLVQPHEATEYLNIILHLFSNTKYVIRPRVEFFIHTKNV